ncbi:hypothetical protein NE237_007966 [Protea cynaroides]|uniref:EID1-like F-box protein 2 n=1 Tax=Protea cynaroides TaxID=273540 RepID=A0A9Q0KQF3_9MAGN|nr:hypothetical protein NE237_007966 [Protea cynaroides]
MLVTKQYHCIHSSSCACTKGHLNEDTIFLVCQHLNWNPMLIAILSCICKWFDDIAKRVLWKEFCRTRAPKMMLDLQSSGSHSVDGNWKALEKLLIHCSGCNKGGLNDVLYVSDPCEHLDHGEEGNMGFFRRVFKSFSLSRVMQIRICQAPCPYCKAKLWSMLQEKMIPKSACSRLGAYDDCIEYYVCLNGHMLGICTFLPLSDSEEASELE